LLRNATAKRSWRGNEHTRCNTEVVERVASCAILVRAESGQLVVPGTSCIYQINVTDREQNGRLGTGRLGYIRNKLRGMSPRANYTQQSDRRLSAKLVPTFADRGCHVVSVTDPYGRILGFLHRSRYFLFQVAPQLYSRG
jgi:hypothetical protein